MTMRNKSIGDRVRIYQMYDSKGNGFATDCLDNSCGVSLERAIELCAVFGHKPSTVFAQISFDGKKDEKVSYILGRMTSGFRMIDDENDCLLDEFQQTAFIEYEEVMELLKTKTKRISQDKLVTLIMQKSGISDGACFLLIQEIMNHECFDTAISDGRFVYKLSETGHAHLQGNRPCSEEPATEKFPSEFQKLCDGPVSDKREFLAGFYAGGMLPNHVQKMLDQSLAI